MKRCELNTNSAYPQAHGQLERSEEAKIAGEFGAAMLSFRPLSTPLVEWSQESNQLRVQMWFRRRFLILQDYAPAFWFLARCEAEGINFLKLTFDEIGKERGVSRQHIQQEFEKIIAVLNRHEPKLAQAIWDYREHKCYSVKPE